MVYNDCHYAQWLVVNFFVRIDKNWEKFKGQVLQFGLENWDNLIFVAEITTKIIKFVIQNCKKFNKY